MTIIIPTIYYFSYFYLNIYIYIYYTQIVFIQEVRVKEHEVNLYSKALFYYFTIMICPYDAENSSNRLKIICYFIT